MKYPKPKRTNMVCVCTYVDVSYQIFDKQNIVHITTVVRYRVRDYGERKDLPKKKK